MFNHPPQEKERQARLVAICATGPSFNQYLAGVIQQKFSREEGNRIVAVSDAYTLLPDADVLVASDLKWWHHHKPEFWRPKFCAQQSGCERMEDMTPVDGMPSYLNSGALALEVATRLYRPERIYLIGFDCHNRDGDHFFGAHPPQLTTTRPERFEKIRREIQERAVYARSIGCSVVCSTKGSDLLIPASPSLPPIAFSEAISESAVSQGLQ